MSDFSLDNTLLSRQAILDRNQELIGYDLSLILSDDAERQQAVAERTRIAGLVCAAYAELGIRSALGSSTAFLHTDLVFLHDDAFEALPPDGVVLELVLDTVPDARTLERCRALRERRYTLALADYTGLDDCSRPLLTLVDVIKIDIRQHDEASLRELAGPLTRLPLKLLAHGVDTPDDFERCHALGFQLFQGNYFARAETVSGRRLAPSQTRLIQIINLAARDADTTRIEEGIKHEPALAVNLLRIVNSVGFGLTRRITSLRHAITLLGRRQLQRWLQLLLMTPAGQAPDARRQPLLQVAALRGRMMELLVEHCHPRQRVLADQAFIAGLMSMMPAALGLPMDEIIAQIDLEAEIVTALEGHAGPLGALLGLIEAFDAEDQSACNTRLAALPDPGLTPGMLNVCLMEALRWVNGDAP